MRGLEEWPGPFSEGAEEVAQAGQMAKVAEGRPGCSGRRLTAPVLRMETPTLETPFIRPSRLGMELRVAGQAISCALRASPQNANSANADADEEGRGPAGRRSYFSCRKNFAARALVIEVREVAAGPMRLNPDG